MSKKIAIVTPTTNLGVRMALSQIYKGLRSENYHVNLLVLQDPTIPYLIYNDLKNVKHLEDFDTVLYTGSIAWPSHMLISGPKKALFIHGFIDVELINSIRYGSLRVKFGASSLLVYKKIFSSWLIKLDFSICHSLTSREINKVTGNCIIIPQFIIEEDVEFYNAFSRLHEKAENTNDIIKIVTYTSLARSPRLLSRKRLTILAKRLSRLVKRKFVFYIIDPINSTKSSQATDSDYIKILGCLPRLQYLKLIASSNLYIERGLDEEIGYGSLEAGLISTPIAKITLSRFISRQDYNRGDLLSATSIESLTEDIAEYINNIEHYEPQYRKKVKNFILSKRVWRRVKKPLIEELERD